MADRRIVSAAPLDDEAQFEAGLRPRRLEDFTGQPKLKENLAIAIAAARQRGEALDHVLLYGPPGLGKTTLAAIIAEELGVEFQQTAGPILQKKLDLTGILTNIKARQVFFIDEIHGDWRDHAAGAGQRTAARALWIGAAAQPLRRRGAAANCEALGAAAQP